MKSASVWRMKVVLVIVAALLAAACSRADRTPGSQTTLGSDVGADGGQATAGDMTVVLPPGSVTGLGKLVVSRQPLPAAPPEGIEVVGDPAQVTLTGATLTAEARVTFAVPQEIDGVSSFPVVVWEDEFGSWRWLPAEWTPGEPTITATIDQRDEHGELLGLAKTLGLPVLVGRGADPSLMDRVSLPKARAVAAVTSDDLENIAVAMAARKVHPEVRVVVRVGDGEVANETRSLLPLGLVRDVHRIAGALLAALAVGHEVNRILCIGDATHLRFPDGRLERTDLDTLAGSDDEPGA